MKLLLAVTVYPFHVATFIFQFGIVSTLDFIWTFSPHVATFFVHCGPSTEGLRRDGFRVALWLPKGYPHARKKASKVESGESSYLRWFRHGEDPAPTSKGLAKVNKGQIMSERVHVL